jgi:hypothetical protein
VPAQRWGKSSGAQRIGVATSCEMHDRCRSGYFEWLLVVAPLADIRPPHTGFMTAKEMLAAASGDQRLFTSGGREILTNLLMGDPSAGASRTTR